MLTKIDPEILEKVVVGGDLSQLTPQQRLSYYAARCEAAGLDPRAHPFRYLSLQGRLVLYADKTCADQLCAQHKLTVEIVSRGTVGDCYEVHARVKRQDGTAVDNLGWCPCPGCCACRECKGKCPLRQCLIWLCDGGGVLPALPPLRLLSCQTSTPSAPAIDAAQDGGPLAAAAGYRSPEDEPSATWCAMRPAIPLWHRPQARRPRAPWALTLLLLVGLLCWCVGDRVARGSGPNTGAGSASLSTQGGARTKDPPPPPPPPPPQSEGIDEPRVHRVLQPPADREPPLGQDPARTLPGSLRALATWMGAVSLLALFMAGCAAAAGALGILLWQRRRRNEITLGGGE